MVDLRIYRALLVLVAAALIVFAFSLEGQSPALPSQPVTTDAFAQVRSTMATLAASYPRRTPGSPGDLALASYLQAQLSANNPNGIHGFSVRTQSFDAHTPDGPRVLENVVATAPGVGTGTVVLVSHRDASASPATADLSGTALMLALAQAVSGRALNRSLMLVSTSGQIGAYGATVLARSLAGASQPVDAVIVLGNLGSAQVSSPVVVPWSSADVLAPAALVGTLADAVRTNAGIANVATGLGGQLVRLAFPFATTEQAPFAVQGIPAVLLSLSGDLPTPANTALGSAARLTGIGQAVLQTVDALDADRTVSAPGTYLVISHKIVPMWAIRLLALALILPVALVSVDAVARVRRRGHTLARWTGWVLLGGVPFLAGLAMLLLARVAGWLSATPPGAVLGGSQDGRGVPITAGDAAVLGAVLVVAVLAQLFLRPVGLRALARATAGTRGPESPAADAAAVALSVVMSVLTMVIWVANPVAALLLVPALHLWMWLAQPTVRSHRLALVTLLVIGVVPGLLVVAYYLNAYALSPLDLFWSISLMVGGSMSVAMAVGWALALGCLLSATVIAARAMRAPETRPSPPVTVRGPVTYAGPGSLGGTRSALRR
ncbi:MAG: hypothetical protein ACP5H2_02565 [Solirubrobacteraceae bacterium]